MVVCEVKEERFHPVHVAQVEDVGRVHHLGVMLVGPMEVMPHNEARDQLGDVTLLRAGDTLLRLGTVQPMFLQPENTTMLHLPLPRQPHQLQKSLREHMQWRQQTPCSGIRVLLMLSHTPGLRALGPLAPRRKALPWTWRGLMRRCWSPASERMLLPAPPCRCPFPSAEQASVG